MLTAPTSHTSSALTSSWTGGAPYRLPPSQHTYRYRRGPDSQQQFSTKVQLDFSGDLVYILVFEVMQNCSVAFSKVWYKLQTTRCEVGVIKCCGIDHKSV